MDGGAGRRERAPQIGDGFIPEIVDMNLVDQVIAIKSDDAVEMARRLSRELGLTVGVSSGANVSASIQVLNEIGKNKRVVTVLTDRMERYFSTDLYAACQDRVRRCSVHCECPFDKL